MFAFPETRTEFYLRNQRTTVEKLLRLKGPSMIVHATSSSEEGLSRTVILGPSKSEEVKKI